MPTALPMAEVCSAMKVDLLLLHTQIDIAVLLCLNLVRTQGPYRVRH